MIHLTYNKEKDRFIAILEDDLFEDYNNFSKPRGVAYSKQDRGFPIKGFRIWEFLMWFDKYRWQYIMDEDGIHVLEENPWFKDSGLEIYRRQKIDFSILNKGIELSPLQIKDIESLLSKNRVCNFNDAGLGKTGISIVWFTILYNQGKTDSAFIVVPPGMSYQWKREFLKFTHIFKDEDFFLVNNETKVKPFEQAIGKKIMIVPDHMFTDCFVSYRKDYTRSKSWKRIQWQEYVNVLEEWQKKSITLIIDEAHRWKNNGSINGAIKRKALDAHLHSFHLRQPLTATPAINGFEDYHGLISIVDKSAFPLSKEAFAITVAKDIGDKYSPYAIKDWMYNEKAMIDYRPTIQKYSIQRLKKDDPDMKYKQHLKPIYFEMSYLQEQLYNAISEFYLEKLEKEGEKITVKEVFNKFPYLMMVLENPMLLKDKFITEDINKLIKKWTIHHDEKLTYLTAYLDDLIRGQKEKVLLFDYHPETLDMLGDKFNKYKPLVVHGKIKVKDKEKYKDFVKEKFNDKQSDNMLALLSSTSMSAGGNYEQGGNNIIVYSLNNDATEARQLIDRQNRFSSTRDNYVQFLVMAKTLDEIRYNRIVGRIKMNDDFLSKEMSASEIRKILKGEI